MSEPLVLVVLLGTAPDPANDAMMTAARRALGPDAIVLAHPSEVSTDQEALAIGDRVRARAVARIQWQDDFNVARLHVHVAPSDAWSDEEITFAPQDATVEKGRAVGYMLSSMVQRIEKERGEKPVVPHSAITPPAPRAKPAPSARDFDLFASAIGAVDSTGPSVGGSAAARWWPIPHVGARGAVGGRVGEVSSARATTTAFFGSIGMGYRVFVGSSVELGLRGDFVFYRVSLSRTDGGVEALRGRWLGASQLLLEGSWTYSPSLALTLGVGVEVAFGATAVSVGGRTVADLPTARAIAELGARIRF